MARRYYLDGRTKLEIAEEFRVSRFRVARILGRARESGLVRISIVLPARIDGELSEELRVALGLHHAVVVAVPSEPEESLREQLGAAAAVLLSERVRAGDVLGVAWGRTLDAMAQALTSLAPCTVVQLTGASGARDVSEESVESCSGSPPSPGGPRAPSMPPWSSTPPRRQPPCAASPTSPRR